MEKTVIALVGHMGSGKGAAAKYLHETYGIPTFRYSTIVRDVAKRLYISDERKNLVQLSFALRQSFGNDLFARVMKEDMAAAEGSVVVLDGVRRLDDTLLLRDTAHFVLVHIDANETVRLGRINARKENTDDASRTAEKLAAEKKMEAEATIDEVIPHATVVIDNNGDFASLAKQLDDLISTYARAYQKN